MGLDELARWILASPARLGPVRLVAVDGRAGSGKTTFARHLTAALADAGATVAEVHTDDLLEGWSDIVSFWPRLEKSILAPLGRGEAGGYRRYDWAAADFLAQETPVPVADVLVMEGVTSARAEVRDRLSLSVYVHADADLRLRRGIARDGEALRSEWLRWMAREDEHYPTDGIEPVADLVVDGASQDCPPGRFAALCDRRRSQIGTTPAYHHGMTPTMTDQQLRAAIERELPGVRADLERLVRIPGIAFEGFDHAEVERSAQAVADLLRGTGLPDVRIVRAGGQPAVIGRRPAPPGAPTVLLYAHHDVQPVGDLSQWRSEPFEPVERDGRLYGRGAADDKAGVMAHIAALRAFGDQLPVGVVLFIEGEEEFGSESLEDLLREYREEISADVIVIADSSNWEVGRPALTTSLRGIVNLFVEVRTLDHAVHSGMYGGAVPDALTALCRLLTSLHDGNGDVAVQGLVRGTPADVDLPTERFRQESGMLDGVQLLGTGTIAERLWVKPSVSVLGIDAPATREAPNALVPSAKAKISVRIAPGDTWKSAFDAVRGHLERHAPWGAQVTVTLDQGGEPCVINSTGTAPDAARAAFAEAWDGNAPVEVGLGGSIPFIATFQELFPAASILVTGVEDPDSRAHGPNESLHMGEFARVCLAEALLLAKLGEASRHG